MEQKLASLSPPHGEGTHCSPLQLARDTLAAEVDGDLPDVKAADGQIAVKTSANARLQDVTPGQAQKGMVQPGADGVLQGEQQGEIQVRTLVRTLLQIEAAANRDNSLQPSKEVDCGNAGKPNSAETLLVMKPAGGKDGFEEDEGKEVRINELVGKIDALISKGVGSVSTAPAADEHRCMPDARRRDVSPDGGGYGNWAFDAGGGDRDRGGAKAKQNSFTGALSVSQLQEEEGIRERARGEGGEAAARLVAKSRFQSVRTSWVEDNERSPATTIEAEEMHEYRLRHDKALQQAAETISWQHAQLQCLRDAGAVAMGREAGVLRELEDGVHAVDVALLRLEAFQAETAGVRRRMRVARSHAGQVRGDVAALGRELSAVIAGLGKEMDTWREREKLANCLAEERERVWRERERAEKLDKEKDEARRDQQSVQELKRERERDAQATALTVEVSRLQQELQAAREQLKSHIEPAERYDTPPTSPARAARDAEELEAMRKEAARLRDELQTQQTLATQREEELRKDLVLAHTLHEQVQQRAYAAQEQVAQVEARLRHAEVEIVHQDSMRAASESAAAAADAKVEVQARKHAQLLAACQDSCASLKDENARLRDRLLEAEAKSLAVERVKRDAREGREREIQAMDLAQQELKQLQLEHQKACATFGATLLGMVAEVETLTTHASVLRGSQYDEHLMPHGARGKQEVALMEDPGTSDAPQPKAKETSCTSGASAGDGAASAACFGEEAVFAKLTLLEDELAAANAREHGLKEQLDGLQQHVDELQQHSADVQEMNDVLTSRALEANQKLVLLRNDLVTSQSVLAQQVSFVCGKIAARNALDTHGASP